MRQQHSHAACIEACQHCFQTCLAAADGHCLEVAGDHAAPAHLRLMHDCADICQLSAAFMLRRSTFHPRTCALCAEVCIACAADCEALGDEVMRECATICRRCAESCRVMVAAHAATDRS